MGNFKQGLQDYKAGWKKGFKEFWEDYFKNVYDERQQLLKGKVYRNVVIALMAALAAAALYEERLSRLFQEQLMVYFTIMLIGGVVINLSWIYYNVFPLNRMGQKGWAVCCLLTATTDLYLAFVNKNQLGTSFIEGGQFTDSSIYLLQGIMWALMAVPHLIRYFYDKKKEREAEMED